VAITADDRHWFLLNASPDLRFQIEGFAPLRPQSAIRGSPIQSVLLTNADLDHTLGLFLLREGEKLQVQATAAIRHSLSEGISISSAMDAFCGIGWLEPPLTLSPLLNRDSSEHGIAYHAVPLSGSPPRFAAHATPSSAHVIGYRFVDQKTGGRLLFLPGVPALKERMKTFMSDCEVVLFDGTFWSEDEMSQRGISKLNASAMGHVPISGPHGSLRLLRDLKVPQRIYFHINNTNPILFEDGPERAAVLEAGCAVAYDGMELLI
jgi:pyrroloquinoline quinone biosynthesis protein B